VKETRGSLEFVYIDQLIFHKHYVVYVESNLDFINFHV